MPGAAPVRTTRLIRITRRPHSWLRRQRCGYGSGWPGGRRTKNNVPANALPGWIRAPTCRPDGIRQSARRSGAGADGRDRAIQLEKRPFILPILRVNSIISATKCSSSGRPTGTLRCVERCCFRTRQARRSETFSSLRTRSMHARRRAGLRSFPLLFPSGSACRASDQKQPCAAARSLFEGALVPSIDPCPSHRTSFFQR